MKFYNTYILPKITHFVCSRQPTMHQRRKIVPAAQGKVLEIGMGSGLNLPYYDSDKVDHIWGLDPSGPMRKIAEKKIASVPMTIDFFSTCGEEIPLEKNTVDTIVVTYTLCSIPDVFKVFNEMKRVLRPGGKLLFCEHGLAPDENVQKWQERLNPVWRLIGGGCSLNKPIPSIIKAGGFKIENLETMYISGFKPASFNYCGTAISR